MNKFTNMVEKIAKEAVAVIGTQLTEETEKRISQFLKEASAVRPGVVVKEVPHGRGVFRDGKTIVNFLAKIESSDEYIDIKKSDIVFTPKFGERIKAIADGIFKGWEFKIVSDGNELFQLVKEGAK